MESRSLAREVALLVLGQLSKDNINKYNSISIEKMLDLGLDTLKNHWREQLDECASQIELANLTLSKSDFEENEKYNVNFVRKALTTSLENSENILNTLSDTFELSKLLTLSDQDSIRLEAMNRITLVISHINTINTSLDNVMEGWRRDCHVLIKIFYVWPILICIILKPQ